MSKGSKKPRKRMDAKKLFDGKAKAKKEDRDWSFEDIARSKTRRR